MSATTHLPETLHYLMIKHVIETGYAPDVTQLATLAHLSQPKTEEGLKELARMHGVILVPNSLQVWSLHPFALMPTRFWVTAKQGGWWANCAWCSLAIGAALQTDITISTGDGAESVLLEIRIEKGRSSLPDAVMHFPYPPARWWDNPIAPAAIFYFSLPQKKSTHGARATAIRAARCSPWKRASPSPKPGSATTPLPPGAEKLPTKPAKYSRS